MKRFTFEQRPPQVGEFIKIISLAKSDAYNSLGHRDRILNKMLTLTSDGYYFNPIADERHILLNGFTYELAEFGEKKIEDL